MENSDMRMKDAAQKVKDFMQCADQECPTNYKIPSTEVRALRLLLHKEEALDELVEAFADKDIEAVFDSVCDSLVVVMGTAIACGISPSQIEDGFAEVMQSNMTKFVDGCKDAKGKWHKGPSYVPPNLKRLL